MTKRNRTDITDELRKVICLEKQRFPTYTSRDLMTFVENVYGKQLGRSTICEILKGSDKWLQVSDHTKDVRRHKPGHYPELEDALAMWLNEVGCSSGITDNILRTKAKEFGARLGVSEDFKYSSGWLEKLKKRFAIKNGQRSNRIIRLDRSTIRPRRATKNNRNKQETANAQQNLTNLLHEYDQHHSTGDIRNGIEIFDAMPVLTSSDLFPKFTPLFDRIVVEKIPFEIQVRDGVVLPERHQQLEGIILALGPGARSNDGELIPMSLAVGDRVLLPEYGGSKIIVDGKEFFVYRETDILGKWN